MTFTVSFKTPDAVKNGDFSLFVDYGLEGAGLNDPKPKEVAKVIKKFVEYGEYLRVEFDTEKQTATVKAV